MPIATRKKSNSPYGLVFKLEGFVSTDDLIRMSDETRSDENYLFAIVDFSDASLTRLSLPDIHRIAIIDTTYPETHKFEKLALAGMTGTERWLAEAYILFTEFWISKSHEYETRLFNSLGDAENWVGMTNPEESSTP